VILYPPCGDVAWTGRLASDIGHSGYRQSDTTLLKPHGIFLDTGICGGESYVRTLPGEMLTMCIVYYLHSTKDNRPRYVGQTNRSAEARLDDHLRAAETGSTRTHVAPL
jgi:hypothetical protein